VPCFAIAPVGFREACCLPDICRWGGSGIRLGDESLKEAGNANHEPTTAQRCRSETEKNILEDLFSSVLSQLKKYQPFRNLKFKNLGTSQSLKLRI